MNFVFKKTGEILDFWEFRKKFPNISFTTDGPDSAFLKKKGYVKLDGDSNPEIKPGQWTRPTQMAHEIEGKWLRVMTIEGEPVSEEGEK